MVHTNKIIDEYVKFDFKMFQVIKKIKDLNLT